MRSEDALSTQYNHMIKPSATTDTHRVMQENQINSIPNTISNYSVPIENSTNTNLYESTHNLAPIFRKAQAGKGRIHYGSQTTRSFGAEKKQSCSRNALLSTLSKQEESRPTWFLTPCICC